MSARKRCALTLIESTPHPMLREFAYTVLGVAGEVALVAGIAGAAAVLQTTSKGEHPFTPYFLAPKQQPPTQASREQLQYVGLAGAPEKAAGAPKPTVSKSPTPEPEVAPDPTALSSPEQLPAEPQRALSEIEVDSLAERDPESEGPVYPATLLEKQVEGVVRAMFVVDTTGHADPESFRVLDSTDSAFTSAVRTALPRMKYRPAMLRGKVVPQLVEQSFAFRIARPAAVIKPEVGRGERLQRPSFEL